MWSSVSSSLGAAVFVKAGTVLDVKVVKENAVLENFTSSTKLDNDGTRSNEEGRIDVRTFPIIKITRNLWDYERKQTYNVAKFCIGPVLICVNLDLGIGAPVSLNLEADTEISYDCYIAGIAQAGVSAGMDHGIKWKKVCWFVKRPVFYCNSHANTSASADGVYYVDTTGDSFNLGLTKLTSSLTISPYARAGIDLSAAAVVHTGFSLKSGVSGYAKFGFEKPYIIGKYGLNYNNSISANVFLGVKGVKILGIKIEDIGKSWSWELLKNGSKLKSGTIIPETTFLKERI